MDTGIRTVYEVRKAVGDSMDAMVDLNQGWRMAGDHIRPLDVAEVKHIIQQLYDLNVLWLEEPLPGSDVKGLQNLRASTMIRIAGGEMARTLDDLTRFMENDALDVYQPDVVLAAGMYRVRLVAELALSHNHWFSPHTWTNGLGLLAYLHVACGVGGGPYIEFPYDPPTWTIERRDFFLENPIWIDSEGFVKVPDEPGLGAIINESRLFRWEEL